MLHVACSPDARFVPDCAALLASLSNSHGSDVCVHLLHDPDLPESTIPALREVAEAAGASLEAVAVEAERVEGLPRSERFPVNAWYRVLLPDLLPELDRVLYIDCDALVLDPLEELWGTDLSGALIGAVTSPLFSSMVPRLRDELGITGPDAYFNSGVLLIDLAAWRAEEITSTIFDFVASHGSLVWPDQDALNAVLQTRRLHLHPRWNAMPALWELPGRYLPYGPTEAVMAAASPAIVHFVGPYKPWHYRSRHPYRDSYFAYLGLTPWRGRHIEGRTPGQVVLRRLPALWAYRIEVTASGCHDIMRRLLHRSRR